MLSVAGEIRRDEGCMDYAGQFVMIYPCHGMKGNQEWVYGVVSLTYTVKPHITAFTIVLILLYSDVCRFLKIFKGVHINFLLERTFRNFRIFTLTGYYYAAL
jgi:hypothetical protein